MDNKQQTPGSLTDEELTQQLAEMSGKNRAIYVFIVIGAVLILIGFLGGPPFLALIGLLLVLGVVLVLADRSAKRKKLIADNLISAVLSETFALKSYDATGHIDEDAVQRSDLVDGWDEAIGSDCVNAVYRGLEVSFSDVRLDQVTHSTDPEGDEHESRTTMFAGQWIVLSTRRAVAFPVRVIENKTKHFGYKKSHSDVDTEDAAFNDKYAILTEDPHTAFLILTPHFMEYLNAADTAADGRIMFSFRENEVQIAVANGRDLFECKSGDIPVLRTQLRADAKYITNILDELMKNDYLFGEEN